MTKKEPQAICNQFWHKTCLDEGNSCLFKLARKKYPWLNAKLLSPISKGRQYQNSKDTLINFKNETLQNHWANFNQTWNKAFFIEEE